MQRLLLIVGVLIISGALTYFLYEPKELPSDKASFLDYMTAGYFASGTTVQTLQQKYESTDQKVKILLVAGHSNEFPGATFNTVREVELNVALAPLIYELFSKNDQVEVTLVNDALSFKPEIEQFFDDYQIQIERFIDHHKQTTERLRQHEYVSLNQHVFHNAANENVAQDLYALNYFANEHDYDIVLHVHFNDYPRDDHGEVGEYNGFALYVPSDSYRNSAASYDLAKSLAKELRAVQPVSSHPLEKQEIIPDSELIAVGAYNTLDAASVLIEYGYIYEEEFVDEAKRQAVFEELAHRTYRGVVGLLSEN